ncbi:MAG: hydroxymethylpyrimidine/phosphomethylpyrimidine kinase [Solirubrobacteraceae bacterium]|nr:hydroxymethylpyrimidine/phosphomethylpyrimidine kinase [Solirubrobacteraceae bacterium]
MASLPRVLTIAGSDSGGGAGIQADLKALARCGVHGMTAITVVTAQSTRGIDAVHRVPSEIVVAQIRSVAADIGIDAIKIGMLGDAETVAAVAGCLLQLPDGIPIVVDPVLVATSGARLLAPEALDALVGLIVPLATVVTPNLPEARALVGAAVDDGDAADLARSLHRLGPGAVVVTGGHRAGEAVDVFFDGREVTELAGPRHPGGATHGSGCTHSAALAAHLALGASPLEAARQARAIAAEAIGHGLDGIGGGEGPVDALGAWRENAHPTPGRLP